MTKNEVIQWSIVGVFILGALFWAAIYTYKLTKQKGNNNGCGCCSQNLNCKIKELKDVSRQRQKCHDGQSARN